MSMPRVLVIDDNPSVATALEILFSLHEMQVEHAATPDAGVRRVERGDIDLVIQDMNFESDYTSGDEGVELFHRLRAVSPDLTIILLTAWTQLEHAVALSKAGAADYLSKPWDDNKLVASALTLIELHDLQRAATRQRTNRRERQERLARHYDLRGFVFVDEVTEQAVNLACQVAKSPLPILIQGESGVGKDLLAALIHRNSAVSHGPLISLNCGAIPEDMLESELFGAEAGAFKGVTRSRGGKLEAADGGTLVLEDIAQLSIGNQAKLLRVIETGRFTRLGSNRERHAAFRVITTSNADLQQLVAQGLFRQDLLYRLNGVTVELAPLRQRHDDIVPLAKSFLTHEKSLSTTAEDALRRSPWHGNVRELRSTIQRACVLAQGSVIEIEHLMLPANAGILGTGEPDADSIRHALSKHRGVIAQAAAELGLSRQALYRRMDLYGIAKPQ